MALRVSKKTGLILGIVMAVLMIGAGGYLLWRTNQDSTIAPADSEAGYCQSKIYRDGGWICITYGGDEVPIADPNGKLSGKEALVATGNNTETGNEVVSAGSADYSDFCTGDNVGLNCDSSVSGKTSGCTYYTDCNGTKSVIGKCSSDANDNHKVTATGCDKTSSTTSTCGDNTCDSDENANTCPKDCSATCGDGYCTHDENANTCPGDCEATCGDGYCTHDEDASTCPEDCNAECGDGICTADSENANSCPDDCGATCGDGYCTHDETEESCPDDCGEDVITEYPDTGLFDNVSNSIKLGLGFISLGFITTQANKVVTAYDVVLQNREIKIRKKRRNKIEKDF